MPPKAYSVEWVTFYEERLQGLEEPRELLCHTLVHATMEVHADIQPQRAHVPHPLDRLL